jgi:hypothetical protein
VDHIEFQVECPQNTLTLAAQPTDQIRTIKELILKDNHDSVASCLSPENVLELTYAGKILEDVRTLRDYSIGIGALVYVEPWTIRATKSNN